MAVTYGPEELVIEVVDDGPGPKGANEKGNGHDATAQHHGIVGMRERTAMFGGTLAVGPLPGNGYRVLARLPISVAP